MKYKVRMVSRDISVQMAGDRRKKKIDLTSKLDSLDPETEGDEITDCQQQLDKMLAQELDTIRLLAGVKFVKEGEKCTAFFMHVSNQDRNRPTLRF